MPPELQTPSLGPGTKQNECVKVVVRCRPMSQKEIEQGHERIVEMDTKMGNIELRNIKNSAEPPKTFTFDAVYDWNSNQRDLYDETFEPLVSSVLQGFNGTIFAYGQTGTGKTYTMEGIRSDAEKRGVIPNSFDQIFQHIARSENQQYLVRASYLEIYQEEIRDLLHKDQKKRLELKERADIGIYVKDLSSFVTKSVQEIDHVMNVGNQNRSVGSTNMNEHSSRSHAIFMVTVECSEPGLDGKSHIRVGRLNLVDLAGSERQSKTGSSGERFKEATKINLSLSALGNVISALVDGKSSHVPYRDSKLTRLLQDSLGGNARTVMVANIGPANYNLDESLSTLRYANRAKNIKNKPKINEDPKDALLREFQDEINRLKNMLDAKGGKVGGVKKKKTKVGKSGESLTELDESEVIEQDPEEYLKEQQAMLEKEREAIMANKNIMAEEKERFLKDIEDKAHQLKAQEEAQSALTSKIKAMESKLLSGGKNIVDHTNEQQKELEIKRHLLAEQKRREREMLQQLELQEGTAIEIQQTYSSLQQEVEVKTKKLKKMFIKLQQIKADMRDANSEHSKERQELDTTITELTKELKIKTLIIDNFVPEDVRSRLLQRAVYKEEDDEWTLKAAYSTPPQIDRPDSASSSSSAQLASVPVRPVSVPGSRRPISDFARISSLSRKENGLNNIRFRGENVIILNLDMPPKLTKDYSTPDVAPGLQDALDEAMREEDEESAVMIDVSGVKKFNRKFEPMNNNKLKSNRPKNGDGPGSDLYPKARGLVK